MRRHILLLGTRRTAAGHPRAAARRAYGEWAKGRAANGGLDVFGGYADEYDMHRPFYPRRFWDDVELACRRAQAGVGRVHSDLRPWTPEDAVYTSSSDDGTSPPRLGIALDVAAGTGRGAIELARRGAWDAVTAIDLDEGMLAQSEVSARAHGLRVKTLHRPAEDLSLADGAASLIICLQAFHWFEAETALQEFRRVLEPDTGTLVLAWNDRDLSVPWVRELEDILEDFNPLYSRGLKQTEEVMEHGKILRGTFAPVGESPDDSACTAGPIACRSYTNPTPGMTAESLVDLMKTMSYVRNALDETQIADFEAKVHAMIERHHGGAGAVFDMPWTTKAYILQPTWENAFPLHVL